MRKVFYIVILIIAVLLVWCGQSVELPAENGQGGRTGVDAGHEIFLTELPEMGEIHLHTADAPGDEYMAGWCTVDRSCYDEDDGVTGCEENVARVTLPVEIKLRGNSSKEVDKKAYTIKFEGDEALLGMEPGRKWALVSNPFDKSLLRPAVGLTYAQALGIAYTPDFRLCKVWLNDDYMGVYTAMEPIEAGEGRVEIDVTEGGDFVAEEQCDFLLERNMGRYEDDKTYIESSLGIRFEFNEPEEPDDNQIAQCRGLLAAAEDAICSGEHEKYAALIDVDSFVNFYIFYEMIKDIDFGEYSTRYYFEDGIMHAGPPWDLDLTMGNVSTEKEEFKYAAYNNVDGAGDESSDSARGMWASAGDYYYWLCRDPWFMELVQQRWQAVRGITENLAVDNEIGENLIDRYLNAYEEDLSGNFHRWPADEQLHVSEWQTPSENYIENVEMLRTWIIRRAAFLDSRFGPFIYTPALAVQ